MVSSFPKMQKSSASFSQSVRNRLRLKKLQAQAKNFCRVLDIRVAEAVNIYVLKSGLFHSCVMGAAHVAFVCAGSKIIGEDPLPR